MFSLLLMVVAACLNTHWAVTGHRDDPPCADEPLGCHRQAPVDDAWLKIRGYMSCLSNTRHRLMI